MNCPISSIRSIDKHLYIYMYIHINIFIYPTSNIIWLRSKISFVAFLFSMYYLYNTFIYYYLYICIYIYKYLIR